MMKENDWMGRLVEDIQANIQGRKDMNRKKLKRIRRLQPPTDISARALYQAAVREEQW